MTNLATSAGVRELYQKMVLVISSRMRYNTPVRARVLKLADRHASEACVHTDVWVRVPPLALIETRAKGGSRYRSRIIGIAESHLWHSSPATIRLSRDSRSADYGRIAQLVEHPAYIRKVPGSSPGATTHTNLTIIPSLAGRDKETS